MSITLYLIAALASFAGAALFFYRQKIIAQERLKNAAQQIRTLKAMLENRDHLNDPASVKRVLQTFGGRADETVRADAGAEDVDGDGAGDTEPEDAKASG